MLNSFDLIGMFEENCWKINSVKWRDNKNKRKGPLFLLVQFNFVLQVK